MCHIPPLLSLHFYLNKSFQTDILISKTAHVLAVNTRSNRTWITSIDMNPAKMRWNDRDAEFKRAPDPDTGNKEREC